VNTGGGDKICVYVWGWGKFVTPCRPLLPNTVHMTNVRHPGLGLISGSIRMSEVNVTSVSVSVLSTVSSHLSITNWHHGYAANHVNTAIYNTAVAVASTAMR